MTCDVTLKPRQTISQRADEVRKAIAKINAGLQAGQITAKVGPQGAITFLGITAQDRDGITDGCVYRRIMATGSMAAKMAIQKAEQLAGRTVNREAVAHGHHSHDGGHTWHHGH